MQAKDSQGNLTMEFLYMGVISQGDTCAVAIYTAEKVHANRGDIMLALTVLAALLIIAITVLATIQLNRVVVRRINETNNTLGKITNGNLNERIDIRDSMKTAKEVGGDFYDFFLVGEERLVETLYAYADMNPRSIGVGVRRALADYTLDADQSDDITMLCLKYGAPPPEKRALMILDANDRELVHTYNFIHEELHRRRAPKSAYAPLDIAAEELFVNVCHYAYPDATPENPGEVRISFVYEANPPSLTVQIADDGIPYNPLAKPDAVTPDDIMDAPIGGLGILMAKRSVDDMYYEYKDETNIVTFRKGW